MRIWKTQKVQRLLDRTRTEPQLHQKFNFIVEKRVCHEARELPNVFKFAAEESVNRKSDKNA